ncbi:hypothetical protein Fmac_026729 [Flemingia macrophylla]|uniref:Uncharacterized protein n=1 Tax=Flemingia macrophylla TaxID=520843 RepID=A0ABD1LFN9_9FABA
MEKRVQGDWSVKQLEGSFNKGEELEDSGSTVEEKTRSIVKSLSHTLEKLKTKTKEAKQENKLISREVAATKEDIQKIDFDMNLTEKRLQDVIQELEAARASEAHALDKLKTLT